MYRALNKCPVCDGKLVITKLSCSTCGTSMEGQFEGCRFCSLSPEESRFLLTFIKNRGSIKDVEREMGVSYPTVRAALDGLISSLGLVSENASDRSMPPSDTEEKKEPSGERKQSAKNPDKSQARKDILALLAQHRITADEAAKRLQKL